MGRMMEKRREMGQRKEGREAETKTNSAKKRFSILLLTAGLISVTTLICRCAQFSLTKAIEFIQLRLLPLSQEATNALTQTFHPSTSDRLSHYFQSSWVVFFMLLGFFFVYLFCFCFPFSKVIYPHLVSGVKRNVFFLNNRPLEVLSSFSGFVRKLDSRNKN